MASRISSAERLKGINPSGIRRFFALADEAADSINLSVGEPDFSPPERALNAGWEAVRGGRTHYTPTNGIPELRDAIAQKAYCECGLHYDPKCEVVVTVGASEAVFSALFGMINPGDEVLVPDPGFVLYDPVVRLAGGKPVHVPLLEDREFRISASDVTSLITEKSRVMILNYPNNPTGGVLSYDECAALAKVATERDLIVISDEVYEKIVYDGAKHYCFATFPGMRERTVVVNSFSKTYAMTGLRIGYACGPKELISALWLVHQYAVSSVNSFAQYSALEAVKGPQGFVDDMVREFDRRRRMVHERLNAIQGVRCSLPKGAFYVFPNIASFGMTSDQFAEFLFKEARVVTVPGSAFGSKGEGHIRISYAAAFHHLEEAVGRIESVVRSLR